MDPCWLRSSAFWSPWWPRWTGTWSWWFSTSGPGSAAPRWAPRPAGSRCPAQRRCRGRRWGRRRPPRSRRCAQSPKVERLVNSYINAEKKSNTVLIFIASGFWLFSKRLQHRLLIFFRSSSGSWYFFSSGSGSGLLVMFGKIFFPHNLLMQEIWNN